MRQAAFLAFLAAIAMAGVSTADGADRWTRGYGYHHSPYYARHGRTVYSVYRSPRFVPPPAAPQPFFFEFFPTSRVNTHMY